MNNFPDARHPPFPGFVGPAPDAGPGSPPAPAIRAVLEWLLSGGVSDAKVVLLAQAALCSAAREPGSWLDVSSSLVRGDLVASVLSAAAEASSLPVFSRSGLAFESQGGRIRFVRRA